MCVSIRSTDSEWRQYRVETLYTRSGNIVQSEWRNYTVRMGMLNRLETPYNQNRNIVQTGDTIESELKH